MALKKQRVARPVEYTSSPRRTLKVGSVQARFVDVRSVHDAVICLAAPTSGRQEYVTILQVEGISYDLKSEAEQQLINELYQAFLSALPYPIQILWRVLPLNLSEYVKQFPLVDAGGSEQQSEASWSAEEGIWQPLAASHRTFLERLAAQRTLLDRSIYLVVRVTHAVTEPQSAIRHRLFPQRKRQHVQQATTPLEKARQELDLRVNEITRLLTNMHVSVRRLSGERELVPLYYSCLTPQRAMQYPLAHEIIDGIQRPVQMKRRWSHMHHQTRHTSLSRVHGSESQDTMTTAGSSDFSQLADMIAPAAVVVSPDCLKVDGEYTRTIIVSHLPRIVAPGWLKPLAELDEPMEVSFHLSPLNSALMVHQFQRRQMEYQSSHLIANRQGNEVDPHVKVAESDVDRLIDRLASGEERMLDLSILVVVRGSTRRALDERTERVQSVLHNMLLNVRTALFEQEPGFRSCLPYAQNQSRQAILLDSHSASTLFPFLSNSLFHPEGVLEGITSQGDPVVLDAWSAEMANANRIILGPPGWGKSHQVKASIVRMALKYAYVSGRQDRAQHTFQVIVIDPEREYGRMTAALGGQVIRLAPGAVNHINPFDLPTMVAEHLSGAMHTPLEHGDRLADHVQKLHTLLEMMLADRLPDQAGTLTANEKGLLDRALYECYRKVGITADVKTHDRSAPLMRDLYDVFESGVCGPDPTGITQRLRRYVHGSLAGLFAGPSDIALDRAVIVFDIHDMETELRPIGLFLVSNFVWTQSFQSQIPRQLIVDEAATLYQYESGAHFLEDLVRRARKHYLGVTIISQHPVIFRESAIPANCATHVLMRQDATSLDVIGSMFKLSDRELQLLRRLGIGEALLTTE